MAVTKKIEIDGKEVTFKASAAVPRLYRIKFGRDIYKDLRQLEKSVGENDEDNSNLDLFSLEMFEDLAWLMARHADAVCLCLCFCGNGSLLGFRLCIGDRHLLIRFRLGNGGFILDLLLICVLLCNGLLLH